MIDLARHGTLKRGSGIWPRRSTMRLPIYLLTPLLSLGLLPFGCVVGGMEELSDTGQSTTSPSTSGDNLTVNEDSDESSTTGDDEGVPSDPQDWAPARGIEITEVEANQGVAVPLTGEGGEWIGLSDRNAPLVGRRDTMLRVHWRVDPGWTPHEVQARLRALPGEGEAVEFISDQLIEADSSPGSLSTTMWFALPGTDIYTQSDTRFEITVYEHLADQDLDLPELVNQVPTTGPAAIGFEAEPMELEIVFVPVHYNFGGLDLRPELGENDLNLLLDGLHQMLPVQEVFFEVHEDLEYEEELLSFGPLLEALSELKQVEGAESQVYYVALVDKGCGAPDCTLDGTQGLAFSPGDGEQEGHLRVAATLFAPSLHGVELIVHQLGHAQGLDDIACPDALPGETDPDPDYPHLDGSIGGWGFGIRDFRLYDPASHVDVMGLCQPRWISDWSVSQMHARVKTLSAWNPKQG